MFRMAVGHSDDIDVERALDAVIEECEAVLAGAVPSAGLLLASWDSDHRAMIDRVRARYPGIELAGTSSSGEMSSVLGFSDNSVALALFASDTVDIVAGMGRNVVRDPIAASRAAVEDALASRPAAEAVRRDDDGRPGGGVGDPGRPAPGPGSRRAHPRRRRLAEGSADDPRNGNDAGREIAGDVVTDDAIAILLFCGPLAMSYGVDTGWRGVGPMATVTGVTADGVATIDGRPALEFYEKYLGTVTAGDRQSPRRVRCPRRTTVLPPYPDRVRPGDGLRDLLRRDPRRREGPADGRGDRRDLRRRTGVDRRCAGDLSRPGTRRTRP